MVAERLVWSIYLPFLLASYFFRLQATNTMRKSLLPIFVSLALFGCGTPSGVSEESSRPPKGNPSAAVIVSEYADLQCPACRAAHTQITMPLLEEYGDRIRYDFQHFPLRNIHRYALEAAMAAECAADQGKFWEFVDVTFEKQPEMTADALQQWGRDLVGDNELFESCYRSQSKKKTVLANYEEGRAAGVSGTPTFFVNGERVDSRLTSLKAAIDAKLQTFEQPL